MKNIRFSISSVAIVLLLAFASCNSKPTVAPWTNTMAFLTNRGVADKDATDFANCMLEKTSAQYTFDQATHLTDDEARKLWQQCDYQW
jgi:predicted metal-binding protein